jgi:hypothetical protein
VFNAVFVLTLAIVFAWCADRNEESIAKPGGYKLTQAAPKPKKAISHKFTSASVVVYPSGGPTPKYQYKYFHWSPIQTGNCHQIDGTLMLRSDGHGTFDATIWTDHTVFGDVWHAWFQVYDKDKIFLFPIGNIDSPKTHGEHEHMHGEFTFPAGKFSPAAIVVQNSSC